MTTDGASFLPFKADYAKSARASCKFCSSIILKDALRLASVTISTRFDGQMVRWFHYACFFEKNRPKSHLEIEGFDELRWEDQENIKKKLGSSGGIYKCCTIVPRYFFYKKSWRELIMKESNRKTLYEAVHFQPQKVKSNQFMVIWYLSF